MSILRLAYSDISTLHALSRQLLFLGKWCPFVECTASCLPYIKVPFWRSQLRILKFMIKSYIFNPCNIAVAINRQVQVHWELKAQSLLDLRACPFPAPFPSCLLFYSALLGPQKLVLSSHFQSTLTTLGHWTNAGNWPLSKLDIAWRRKSQFVQSPILLSFLSLVAERISMWYTLIQSPAWTLTSVALLSSTISLWTLNRYNVS